MKKYIIIFILMFSFIISQEIFNNYDIPEYEYKTFQINGNDLFNMRSSEDYSRTSINLGADYMFMYQSPGYNKSYGLNLNYNKLEEEFEDDFEEENISNSNWSLDLPFSIETYNFAVGFKASNNIINLLNDNKGGFLFADGELSVWGGDDYEDEDDTGDLPLTIGAGYGRVISAKPIAQAYAIADALGLDANDEIISAIAAVIGAEASYSSIYKDNATQQFYNDLAKAAGSTGSAMQIQKVLTSPAYNVSDRFIGWNIKLGLSNNYMLSEDEEDAGTLKFEGNYASPRGMNGQLSINLTYEMDLNNSDSTGFAMSSALMNAFSDNFTTGDDFGSGYSGIYGGHSNLKFSTTYTKDHSYNWSTSANFSFVMDNYTLPGSGDWENGEWIIEKDSYSDSLILLKISTTRAILNQLSLTGSFAWGQFGGDLGKDIDEPFREISSTLTYWVF